MKYTGENRREIAFPLGGIGAGSIAVDGTGRFRDWEIRNRPNKMSLNGFSHFGIKAARNGKTVDARVMNSDLLPGYMGRWEPNVRFHGYGYGPERALLCGVPHFRDSEFIGEYPFGEVRFLDEEFPGEVSLEMWSPFIPCDDLDSSLPCAFFTAKVTNPTDAPIEYTFALTLKNIGQYAHTNALVETGTHVGIAMTDANPDADSMENGCLLFAAPKGEKIAVQQYWYRGQWFDNLGIYWQDFTADMPLRNRVYAGDGKVWDDHATIAVTKTVAGHATWEQRFLIAWRYPNCRNYWSKPSDEQDAEILKTVWKPYYAAQFASAEEIAGYAVAKWDALYNDTKAFHDALYASDLPDAALEAVGANLAILKSSTCMRLENGEFYAFEGVHANEGSCEGSCAHVWNYAFAMPYLFPKLERSMRELDYTYNFREHGSMAFRLMLPLGKRKNTFRACVDGQMGGIIKTYREWKICGDTEWLKSLWGRVKESLMFAWNPANADRWDLEKSGVITGRQHHTLDMELFGANAWLNTFYLGALTAAAEMADAVGDADFAKTCRALCAKGREYTERELFNGEYFQQKIDIRDSSVLLPYVNGGSLKDDSAWNAYWSEEAGQIKYQIGEGCGTDQVLGQWMCELSGLGEILDRRKVDSALHAIYKYNFKPSLRKHFNPCRIYGLNDESGLVICDWGEGREKPVVPIPYAEECMNGFEYQAAVHMLLHGMEKECLDIVRGIRNRYDGAKRNPWSEFECGSNYARSMASYALLLAYSGIHWDRTKDMLSFAPLRDGTYFWSGDGAWGTVSFDRGTCALRVLYGELRIRRLGIPNADAVRSVCKNGVLLEYRADGNGIEADIYLSQNEVMEIRK